VTASSSLEPHVPDLLEQALPTYDVVERHELRADAPAAALLDAALAVRVSEIRVAGLLFRLRGLRGTPDASVLDTLRLEGFEVAGELPGREVVLTAVGRPWTLKGGLRRVDDFGSFAEPGWAKMAMTLRAVDGLLATETRVLLTDAASRRRFRVYWFVVRPFSGLIRRLWLRAAARSVALDRGPQV
jgi:hypothetical protein